MLRGEFPVGYSNLHRLHIVGVARNLPHGKVGLENVELELVGVLLRGVHPFHIVERVAYLAGKPHGDRSSHHRLNNQKNLRIVPQVSAVHAGTFRKAGKVGVEIIVLPVRPLRKRDPDVA